MPSGNFVPRRSLHPARLRRRGSLGLCSPIRARFARRWRNCSARILCSRACRRLCWSWAKPLPPPVTAVRRKSCSGKCWSRRRDRGWPSPRIFSLPESIESLGVRLMRIPKTGDKVKVETGKQYLGLDAYQKVLDSGIDLVLLATPPGFRPVHLAASVAAGKHIFCEKPVSTDAPGVRWVLESTEKARQKNLALVAGFCWRYNNMIQETFQQIQDGAIGRLVAYYATYYTNPVKAMPPEST